MPPVIQPIRIAGILTEDKKNPSVNGSLKVSDDTSLPTALKAGAIRYNKTGFTTQAEMCMETGDGVYEWVKLVSHEFSSNKLLSLTIRQEIEIRGYTPALNTSTDNIYTGTVSLDSVNVSLNCTLEDGNAKAYGKINSGAEVELLQGTDTTIGGTEIGNNEIYVRVVANVGEAERIYQFNYQRTV